MKSKASEEYSEAQKNIQKLRKFLTETIKEEYDTIISRRILSDSHDLTESVINPKRIKKE